MKTILITGNDTGVGKTFFTRKLVECLVGKGMKVQVVKPVESGVKVPHDAPWAVRGMDSKMATAYTLYTFGAPLAPVPAAESEGVLLCFDEIVEKIKALPEVDYRLVETAGGIAVPVAHTGEDFRDLAKYLEIDRLILVVANRLGAMNQAFLLEYYVKDLECEKHICLNEVNPQTEEVKASNKEALSRLSIPVSYELACESKEVGDVLCS